MRLGRRMTTPRGKKVLVVAEDELFRDALCEQLEIREEFLTKAARTGVEGLELSSDGNFDLVLLDANLPDMDIRDACQRLRHGGLTAPIIMLTSQDSAADIILGPDPGPNDYVTKPFKVATLLDRMRAYLRQGELDDNEVLSIGPYKFRPSVKLLVDHARNHEVRLTEKEAAILTHLYKTGDRIVKRETLLGEVWGYSGAVTTHTLETHVYRLRQKIEPDPSNATILVTESGGYRLVP